MTSVKFMTNGELLRDVARPFSGLFDSFLNEVLPAESSVTFRPRVNVLERSGAYELHLELPGMKKEDISVELDGQKLSISGERKQAAADAEEKYHLVESRYGKFSRSFNLPKEISTDAITAEFQDGILYIGIPKAEPVKSTRTIEIK